MSRNEHFMTTMITVKELKLEKNLRKLEVEVIVYLYLVFKKFIPFSHITRVSVVH